MPQTVKGQNANAPSRINRPGQRQQDRIQRYARRQKRRRIITASVAAALVVILGVGGTIFFQSYTAQQAALATAHANATATVGARATATSITADCFINKSGPTMPAIYDGSATPSSGPSSSPSLSGNPVTLSGGLKYVDIKVGTGMAAASGDSVSVEYTGWLASTCAKFDSSYDATAGTPGAPFTFSLGEGQVIPGWDDGLLGMKPGGIRRLYIPSALAYGSQGQQDQNGNTIIPANADLIFDVQVVSITKG
jgi:hypothetical protein